MVRKRLAVAALSGLLVLGVMGPAQASSTRTLRVTLRNVTSAQIFSPPLIAIGQNPRIFTSGYRASLGLRLVAEEGDSSELAADLSDEAGVRRVIALSDPVMPGRSVTVTVQVRAGEKLSVATMLVQTNDGFTGVSALSLDSIERASIGLRTFDAGTERNNELARYVPGPPFGGHRRAPEGGTIHYHQGIKGTGDIDRATYDWSDPSARLAISQA